MLQATCPSCQLMQTFSQRSPIISGTSNGHDVGLVQCDGCGFIILAHFSPRTSQILHHFPRDIRCMNCDLALRR